MVQNENKDPTAYATAVYPSEQHGTQEWACPQCTLLNPVMAEFCDACMIRKPIAPPEAFVAAHNETEPTFGNISKVEPIVDDHDDRGASEPLLENPSSVEYNDDDDNEDPLQKKRRRRRRRRIRMVLGGIGGLIGGAIIFCGPAGVIFGGIAGAAGARYASKRRERLKDKRVARARAARENLSKLSAPVLN